jgi:hypothetical protein
MSAGVLVAHLQFQPHPGLSLDQHWGKAKGSQEAQKPNWVGTKVKSTCQTWLIRLAVTIRLAASEGLLAWVSSSAGGVAASCAFPDGLR